MWKPQPRRTTADWLGLEKKPAPPGDDRVSSRDQKSPRHLQLRQPGDENGYPPGRNRPARCRNPSRTNQSLLGIVHKASVPRGREVSIPGLEILEHLYKSDNLRTKAVIPRIQTAPHRGRKRRPHGSMPPRKVWKTQFNWLVADWLRLMEPARGESCSTGQH